MICPASPLASQLIDHLIRSYSSRRTRIVPVRSRSSAWCSMSYDGQRHEIELAVHGPGAKDVAHRLVDGITEIQFPLREAFVAEISASAGSPTCSPTRIALAVEALTIRS